MFYTLSQFRKIYKMKCDGDTEWTEKLQPALLAANTQTKKSTSFAPFTSCLGETLTPLTSWILFQNSPNNPDTNTHTMSELDSSDDEFPGTIEGPYELPKNDTNGLIQLLARMIEWLQSKTSRKIRKFKRELMTAKSNATGKLLS